MQLVYMITIATRDKAESYISLFRQEGIHFTLKTFGRGTAQGEVLKYLGLGETEKCLLLTTTRRGKAKKILQILSSERHLDRPGAGVAFTIPVASVCGAKALNYLSGNNIQEAEKEMDQHQDSGDTAYELLLVVSNRGYIDMIMDIARDAGVGGGTVIHALGTGSDAAGKFFGISVGDEKDVIMMVVNQETKHQAMKKIVDNAGPHTKAGCVVFSLPVNGVAGIG